MGKLTSLISIVLVLGLFAGNASAADEVMVALEGGFKPTIHTFIQKYCVSCHGNEKPDAEFDISAFSTMASVTKDPRRWKLVLERLEAKEMPPADAKAKPTVDERTKAIEWLKALHKHESERNAGDPGPVLARRLSNAEYDYTIRDLTGIDIRPTKEFPVDPANESGFDNTGESLSMSPSLVKKYLDAARLVSEHIVLKPNGFVFAPYPIVAETDRDKYAVNRVVQFYKQQPTELADYFHAAWRFQNRTALGKPQATLNDIATETKVSPKYLKTVWETLNLPGHDIGPIAAVQVKFKALPAPVDGKEPEEVRADSAKIRDFIVDLRPWVTKTIENFPARGIDPGSQTMVIWKNRQMAANRMNYAGNALQVNMSGYAQTMPLMSIPQDDEARKRYDESFKTFCAVFPDAFYLSERARVFLNDNNRDSTRNAGRLLSAGFHSQMGYFRDDVPLMKLVLDDQQIAELNSLWKELEFITRSPKRQFKEFLWFERAEGTTYMYSPEFNGFRSEDDDIVGEEKLKKLALVYLTKAERMGNTEEGVAVAMDYFRMMNASIRDLEKAQADSEPSHLKAGIAFAEKAYRRPLTAQERDAVLAFYRTSRSEAGLNHEDAIRDTVTSILMSPFFCYRADPLASAAAGTAIQPLSDYALASRLSYFLWSSMPDQELLARAAAGDLHKPEVLLAQTKRMLQDDRIRGFASEFGGNWLDVRRFEEHNAVDRERFPTFTNDLRAAMFEEPIRFLVDLVQKNGSINELLYGNYTFVNPILAKHYGMPEMDGASSDTWMRVDNAGQYQRGGLLTMSVFLTKNAPGLRTSPVKRGYWVVRRLLGEHVPAPPPDVPVLPTDESKMGDLSLRQMLAKHREDKACSTCHERFDAVGVVFEGFGPTGEWRTKDLGGRPVEIGATFPDGSEGSGIAGLRTYIRDKRQDDFVDNVCQKLLSYALGRSLLPSDDQVIREMRQKLSANDNRFGTLVETIVTSKQFLTRRGALDNMKE